MSSPTPALGRVLARLLSGCAPAALVLTAALSAQGVPDPYTGHDPARMRKAGIEAVGAFVWGGDHTTRDIQSLMGAEPFLCLETEHFKLAVSLAPCSVPTGDAARAALRAELVELRGVLPAVDPSTRVLDGWLRAHLYARRLEALYDAFCQRFGLTLAALARAAEGSAHGDSYRGEGPYLGMRDKFHVLLCRDSGSVNAYLKNFLDLPAPRRSGRYALARGASLLLATAEVMPEEDLRDERTLHATVVYHGAHMLLDGFRAYWHDCPPWFEEGVAHWFRVQAVPDIACFDVRPDELPLAPAAKPWSAKVAQRLSVDGVVPASRLFALERAAAMTFDDHLAAWSRVDFLLRAHAEAFPIFAANIKGPDPARKPPRPSAADVQARPAAALQRVFGWSPADFDAAWRAYVTKSYARV